MAKWIANLTKIEIEILETGLGLELKAGDAWVRFGMDFCCGPDIMVIIPNEHLIYNPENEDCAKELSKLESV